jgi:hypothetical protein
MFDLLNPLFFIIAGSIGVIVPLVLHLIQTSRTVKLPFSTIRFLKLAQKQSASRIRMQNILLWLLRTLMLVMLALAFAMPLLRNKSLGRWFGRSPRDVAIVIDGSFSMDYNLGRSTVWEKAVETATAVVEGLSEQDRVCIFVARDHVEPVIEQLIGDWEEATGRLKVLEFSQTSSELAPAVMEANAALMEVKERREREIHIITDTQALPWEGFGGENAGGPAAEPEKEKKKEKAKEKEEDASTDDDEDDSERKTVTTMGAWDPDKVDKRTVCFVSMLGASGPENMAPVDVEIEPAVTMALSPSKATVRLGYTGPPRGSTVSLFVDDKEVSTRSVAVGSDQAGELSFMVPPLTAGRHAARVQIPDDNLQIDNTFHFVFKVEDRFPALCVGTPDDTFFLRTALSAGIDGKASIEMEWVPPGNVTDEKLQGYSCAFLCNAVPLSAGELGALERFVDGGGLMVIFPGDRGSTMDYQAWTCLPVVPARIESVSISRRKRLLHWEAPRHPLFETLKSLGDSTVMVTVRKTLHLEELDKRAELLVSQGDDKPFLVGRPHGNGYVLLFAVAADRTWSDFPLSPFFLPIAHQVVQFGAGVGSYSRYVWCTESLPLAQVLPEATHDTQLLGPDGETVPIRSAVAETRTVLHIEDLWKAGIYSMDLEGDGNPVPALAVNMTRKESDLTPLDPARVQDLLQVKHVNVALDQDELMTQIQDSRVGRTFGEQLLWLVLILAAAEFFVANFQARPKASLTDELVVDSSGRVKGGAK